VPHSLTWTCRLGLGLASGDCLHHTLLIDPLRARRYMSAASCTTMASNQAAARQAKRFLQERIRSDWAYPDPPPPWSASDEEVRHAHDFRDRYYGESDSGVSGDSGADDGVGPYKFNSPDSVGDAVAITRDARTRRRRARLELEMQENEGLRIWVERRDRWTGAASVRKYGACKRARSIESVAAATPTVPAASKYTPGAYDVVPVAPRLLNTNPIRTSITSSTYPDIFQKVVVSARTPSVPINLADMTQALVLGWKETDDWPPRPGALDPLAGKKRSGTGAALHPHHGRFIDRHLHLEKSVDSVKRILHRSGHHDPDPPHGEFEG